MNENEEMHFLISPAKTLDFDAPSVLEGATLPQFLAHSAELVAGLKRQSVHDLADLMGVSEALAELNVARFRAWSTKFTAANSKPAVLAFNGDVYEGLDARGLHADDLAWAQSHVSILSGLYGLLRPLDRMQAYRLEMGTAWPNARGRNLYAFWGDLLADHLNGQVASDPVPVIVNLASQEYFKAVDRKTLRPRVIECVFEDWKADRYKVISFYAKRARGVMLRQAILHRWMTPSDLESFKAEGYAFDPSGSQPDRLVFQRRMDNDPGGPHRGKMLS